MICLGAANPQLALGAFRPGLADSKAGNLPEQRVDGWRVAAQYVLAGNDADGTARIVNFDWRCGNSDGFHLVAVVAVAGLVIRAGMAEACEQGERSKHEKHNGGFAASDLFKEKLFKERPFKERPFKDRLFKRRFFQKQVLQRRSSQRQALPRQRISGVSIFSSSLHPSDSS